MPVLSRSDSDGQQVFPGVELRELLNGELGARSLTVLDITMAEGSEVTTHIHPTEEAMVVLEGEVRVVLGDEALTVTAGQTVLAPAGVRHGFVNHSEHDARIIAIFPTGKREKTDVE